MPWTRALYPLPLIVALAGLAACTEGDAEDAGVSGDPVRFTVVVEHVATAHPYFVSGSFDTPEGGGEPGPLAPGSSYSFEFHGSPELRLSFATMFVPSNDLFFAPAGEGVALFDDAGLPLSGDITDQIQLWDAGTELDQELGLGGDQAPNQGAPGTGEDDPNAQVRPASESYPELPPVSELIAVTLTALEGNAFRVTIDNLSDDQSLMLGDGTTRAVPLAPGVFVVHRGDNPLFEVGEADRGLGLEALAEDGDPAELAAALATESGVVSPLAPGFWLVHDEGEALFTPGEADFGLGLEGLAEDGDPMVLIDSYADANSGLFGEGYGALAPGGLFSFEFEARPGERLSFASMFGQSNDTFLAPVGPGIELFDGASAPISGELGEQIQLWDLGTEVDELPGAGPNQAPRQSGPDTGVDEDGVVGPVDAGFVYPSAGELVRVTITPTS